MCDMYKKEAKSQKGYPFNLKSQLKQGITEVKLAFQAFINPYLGGRRREVN